MHKTKLFNVHAGNDQLESVGRKAETLLAISHPAELICATHDYANVLQLNHNNSFISVEKALPLVDLNGEWYCSPTLLVLIESSNGTHKIQQGFLAKWTDDSSFFWYEDDQINNVIAWMPMPKTFSYGDTYSLAKDLILKTPDANSFWSVDFMSVNNFPCGNLLSVSQGIPPLTHEIEDSLESQTCLVIYEYGTPNGVFSDTSTSKMILRKGSSKPYWDKSEFYHLHESIRDVIEWMPIPNFNND